MQRERRRKWSQERECKEEDKKKEKTSLVLMSKAQKNIIAALSTEQQGLWNSLVAAGRNQVDRALNQLVDRPSITTLSESRFSLVSSQSHWEDFCLSAGWSSCVVKISLLQQQCPLFLPRLGTLWSWMPWSGKLGTLVADTTWWQVQHVCVPELRRAYMCLEMTTYLHGFSTAWNDMDLFIRLLYFD